MPSKFISAICAALALLIATPSAAQIMQAEGTTNRTIYVAKDKSLSFRLNRPAGKIVVAQPDTAEVVATTDHSFYVRGVSLGSTNLLVYGRDGRLQEVIDVRVGYDAQALQRDISGALPGEHILVRNLGEGVLLTGTASNAGAATRAKAIAEKYAPTGVTSMLYVTASQVVLEVRIMEASRSALQDIGLSASIGNDHFQFNYGSGLIGNTPANSQFNLSGHIGGVSIDAQLQALEEKGAVRTLARPNLVALSGEKASFLAGGEFPFPVPSGLNQITIEFRPYGVKLNFTPTVQDTGLIRLAVEPEVSQLDNTNTIRLNGLTIPALTVRRANTTVELHSGESLAIGGLFQRDYANAVSQVPGLGDVPILGALFRSTRWKRNETELLIIVTPRLATPEDIARANGQVIAGVEPSPRDLILKGKALDRPLSTASEAR